MTISIRRNGDSIIEYNQFNVFGREAIGGYGFVFSLRGSRRGFDNPIIISNIRLSLSLLDPPKPVINNAVATDLIVKCSAYSSSSESLHFETILTKEQIKCSGGSSSG